MHRLLGLWFGKSRRGVKAAPGHCSDVLHRRHATDISAGGKRSWSQNQTREMLGALRTSALADFNGTNNFPVLWRGNTEALNAWSLVLFCNEIWCFSLLLTNGCQSWGPTVKR